MQQYAGVDTSATHTSEGVDLRAVECIVLDDTERLVYGESRSVQQRLPVVPATATSSSSDSTSPKGLASPASPGRKLVNSAEGGSAGSSASAASSVNQQSEPLPQLSLLSSVATTLMDEVCEIVQVCKFFSKRKIRFVVLSNFAQGQNAATGSSHGQGTLMQTLRKSLDRRQNFFSLRGYQLKQRAQRVKHYVVVAPKRDWGKLLANLHSVLDLPLGIIFDDAGLVPELGASAESSENVVMTWHSMRLHTNLVGAREEERAQAREEQTKKRTSEFMAAAALTASQDLAMMQNSKRDERQGDEAYDFFVTTSDPAAVTQLSTQGKSRSGASRSSRGGKNAISCVVHLGVASAASGVGAVYGFRLRASLHDSVLGEKGIGARKNKGAGAGSNAAISLLFCEPGDGVVGDIERELDIHMQVIPADLLPEF